MKKPGSGGWKSRAFTLLVVRRLIRPLYTTHWSNQIPKSRQTFMVVGKWAVSRMCCCKGFTFHVQIWRLISIPTHFIGYSKFKPLPKFHSRFQQKYSISNRRLNFTIIEELCHKKLSLSLPSAHLLLPSLHWSSCTLTDKGSCCVAL
jgi:hypothetical protein